MPHFEQSFHHIAFQYNDIGTHCSHIFTSNENPFALIIAIKQSLVRFASLAPTMDMRCKVCKHSTYP